MKWLVPCVAVLLLAGCDTAAPPATPAAQGPNDAFTRLSVAYARTQVRWLPEMAVFARVPLPPDELPAVAPQAVALRLATVRAVMEQAKALATTPLPPASREALALFLRDRQEELQGAPYPEELFPLSAPDGGFALWAVTALARGEVVPETAADHEAWLQVLSQVPAWVHVATANIDQAEARGLGLAPEAWRALAAQVGAAAAADLVPPAGAWGSVPAAAQQALTQRYQTLRQESLQPALQHLQVRLQAAAARAKDAPTWADLPLGEAWYAYRLRKATGMSFAPREWHEAALAEVTRLEALQATLVVVDNAGASLDAAAPAPAPAAAAPSVPVLRERLPWVEVPAWQRLAPHPAHRDGYGLYRLRARLAAGNVAGAAPELPANTAADSAALAEVRDSLALLVIDTGLHGLGWNRSQALAYLAAHSRWTGAAATERMGAVLASSAWMAAPAAGYLRLWQLREALALQQGAAFDEALFDQQLGAWGPLPLEVLEQRMRAWAVAP